MSPRHIRWLGIRPRTSGPRGSASRWSSPAGSRRPRWSSGPAGTARGSSGPAGKGRWRSIAVGNNCRGRTRRAYPSATGTATRPDSRSARRSRRSSCQRGSQPLQSRQPGRDRRADRAAASAAWGSRSRLSRVRPSPCLSGNADPEHMPPERTAWRTRGPPNRRKVPQSPVRNTGRVCTACIPARRAGRRSPAGTAWLRWCAEDRIGRWCTPLRRWRQRRQNQPDSPRPHFGPAGSTSRPSTERARCCGRCRSGPPDRFRSNWARRRRIQPSSPRRPPTTARKSRPVRTASAWQMWGRSFLRRIVLWRSNLMGKTSPLRTPPEWRASCSSCPRRRTQRPRIPVDSIDPTRSRQV